MDTNGGDLGRPPREGVIIGLRVAGQETRHPNMKGEACRVRAAGLPNFRAAGLPSFSAAGLLTRRGKRGR